MDGVLREQVGKTCHVYMDDILFIFSKTNEQLLSCHNNYFAERKHENFD